MQQGVDELKDDVVEPHTPQSPDVDEINILIEAEDETDTLGHVFLDVVNDDVVEDIQEEAETQQHETMGHRLLDENNAELVMDDIVVGDDEEFETADVPTCTW